MRISHFLARCGFGSRRQCEEFVKQGRVLVNGEVTTDLARQVEPGADHVEIDGRVAMLAAQHLTLALHKPPEVMVTRRDPQGRRTVYDMLPPEAAPRANELVYAGRLDFLTSGLLIMTTDGVLVNHLTHPSRHVEKAYLVATSRSLLADEIGRICSGIELDDGPVQPCTMTAMAPTGRGGRIPRYEIVLREGRNRQVRRMIEAVDARVMTLCRTRVGGLTLQKLGIAEGEVKELTPDHIALLRE